MLDLIKYIVEQFAEDKENVEYAVEEKERVIEVTITLSPSEPPDTKRTVQAIIDDTMEQLEYQLMDVCTELKGYWYSDDYNSSIYQNMTPLTAFYSSVYGRSVDSAKATQGMGACIENTTMVRCLDFNSDEENQIATYNADKDECVFTDEWYKIQCEMIGGYYESAVCWVEK